MRLGPLSSCNCRVLRAIATSFLHRAATATQAEIRLVLLPGVERACFAQYSARRYSSGELHRRDLAGEVVRLFRTSSWPDAKGRTLETDDPACSAAVSFLRDVPPRFQNNKPAHIPI